MPLIREYILENDINWYENLDDIIQADTTKRP